MQIARDQGYEVVEHALVRTDLYLADEAFFTGTAAEIVPIAEVDDRKVGAGKPGPVDPGAHGDLLGRHPRRGGPLQGVERARAASRAVRLTRAAGRDTGGVLTDVWPLFGLVLRTPRLELRLPSLEQLAELGELAAEGVHDPAVMPFFVAWTDRPPAERARSVMQYQWARGAGSRRRAGRWSSSCWPAARCSACRGSPPPTSR